VTSAVATAPADRCSRRRAPTHRCPLRRKPAAALTARVQPSTPDPPKGRKTEPSTANTDQITMSMMPVVLLTHRHLAGRRWWNTSIAKLFGAPVNPWPLCRRRSRRCQRHGPPGRTGSGEHAVQRRGHPSRGDGPRRSRPLSRSVHFVCVNHRTKLIADTERTTSLRRSARALSQCTWHSRS
jgi:hypothetical protein